jgi:superfamily II DNA or RNA helicase
MARFEWPSWIETHPWQERAFASWVGNGRRGIIDAATGTGKSAVALRAIAELSGEFGEGLRIAIVSPTIALADQWREQLKDWLGARDLHLGNLHSGGERHRYFDPKYHCVLIGVLASARDVLPDILAQWKRENLRVLLIVDECHRAAAESSSRIFDEPADFVMGLSAVPERPDGQEEVHLYPNIGRIVFRYDLKSAIRDGVIAEITSINLYVDFDQVERELWRSLAEETARALGELFVERPGLQDLDGSRRFLAIGACASSSKAAQRVLELLDERQKVLESASNRHNCHQQILMWLAQNDKSAIIFHESIEKAKETYKAMTDLHVKTRMDHSQMKAADRRNNLRDFREGRCRVFVAVRSLDEGIDVPSVSVAMISAGTKSRRQRVQRLGRVIRKSGNTHKLAVTILVRGTPEESVVGAQDGELLEDHRVRHHRWPKINIEDAQPDQEGRSLPSTYSPNPWLEPAAGYVPYARIVDELMLQRLGLSRDWSR